MSVHDIDMDIVLFIEYILLTLLVLFISYAWTSYIPCYRNNEEPQLTYELFHQISHLVREDECVPLGDALGLSSNVIRAINFKHRFYGTSEVVYQLLFRWKQERELAATTKTLFNVLRSLGREDIIKDVMSTFELKKEKSSVIVQGKYDPEEIVSDEIIEIVSERIRTKESKIFNLRLKLKNFTPVWFNKRYLNYNSAEISYQSLTMWRKTKGENATNTNLAAILIKIHRTDIVDELFPGINIEKLSVATNKEFFGEIWKTLQKEPVRPNDVVSDEDIEVISEALKPNEWRRFGLRLGMDHVKFVWFNRKYLNYGVSEICYQMLKNWKIEYGSNATYIVVCDALQRIHRKDVVDIIAPGIEIPPWTPNRNNVREIPRTRGTSDDESILSDEEMEQISQEIIDNEWKNLGKHLGIENPKLVWFNCRYLEFGVPEITYQILKEWRQRWKQEATVKKVIRALVKIKRQDIVQRIYPDIILPQLQLSQLAVEQEDQIDGKKDMIISENHLHDAVTDEVIGIVSQKLQQDEWKELGNRLGMDKLKLVWFNHNYLNFGSEEITSQMLQAWRRTTEGQLFVLLKALTDISRHDISQAIFPDYISTLEQLNLYLADDSTSEKEKNKKLFLKLRNGLREKYSQLRSPTIPFLMFENDPLETLDMKMTCYAKNRQGSEDKGFIINHDQIFREEHQHRHRRILVEGAAGHGKTLLCCKIASDWATGEDNYVVARFDAVLLVDLWRFNGVQSLEEMFLENFTDTKLSDSEKLEIIESFEDKILLILDGFDELSDRMKTLLLPLLNSELYPRMTVVITARTGVFHLWENKNITHRKHEFNFWSKRLVINGITDDMREDFLRKYCGRIDSTLNEQLLAIVNKEVGNLCTSPLYLFLFILLAKETNITHIKTVTEFFQTVVNFIVGKHGMRQGSSTIPHNVNVFASHQGLRPIYVSTLLDFGELALDNLQLESFEKSDRDRMNEFIEANPVLKDGFMRHTTNKESFEPVHRCFVEFFAAFYLSSFIGDEATDTERFNKKIVSLMKEGLRPNADSMFFPFLTGLLGNKAHVLFSALSPWASYYPIYHQEIANMLYETEPTDKLVTTLKCFIPSKWNIGHNPKFSRTPWHKILLSYGTKIQRNSTNDETSIFLIEVIEWDLQYWCYLPEEVTVDTIILYIWNSDIHFGKNMLSNIKSLKCNELIWSLNDFNLSIWDTVIDFIPTVNTEKIVIDVNGDSNVNVVTQIMDRLYEELIKGSWKELKINRLKVIGLNRETDRKIISMIKDLIDQGKINKGLGLKMLSPDKSSIEEENAYKTEEKELFNALAESETFEEFSLVNFIRDLIPEFDLSHMCNADRTSWKYIQIEGSVVLKIDSKSNSHKCLPLEVMGLGKWPKNVEMEAKILDLCHQIKGLECESGIFQTLFHRLTDDWPGYKSLQELSLSIVEETFHPVHFEYVKSFTNLQVFTLDTLLFYQCMLPSGGDYLISIVSSLPLKILYLKGIHEWHLKFVEHISENLFNLKKSILPNNEINMEANDNTNLLLQEFKLSFDHNQIDDEKLKVIFKYLRQLLSNKRISRFSVVTPSAVQEQALSNTFFADEGFLVQLEIDGFGSSAGVINTQMKFRQEIEEKISVSYFGQF